MQATPRVKGEGNQKEVSARVAASMRLFFSRRAPTIPAFLCIFYHPPCRSYHSGFICFCLCGCFDAVVFQPPSSYYPCFPLHILSSTLSIVSQWIHRLLLQGPCSSAHLKHDCICKPVLFALCACSLPRNNSIISSNACSMLCNIRIRIHLASVHGKLHKHYLRHVSHSLKEQSDKGETSAPGPLLPLPTLTLLLTCSLFISFFD